MWQCRQLRSLVSLAAAAVADVMSCGLIVSLFGVLVKMLCIRTFNFGSVAAVSKKQEKVHS